MNPRKECWRVGSFFTVLVLIVCLAFIIRHMVRQHKNGGFGCGCGCSGCSSAHASCSCQNQKNTIH
ncbi:MAG: FeoB-associated Cys-rich membrane protein [Peptococcaceae bacterium]|nr:FeoB-associated Cys-rich membrane protein [Peptococcaceae bacterium]